MSKQPFNEAAALHLAMGALEGAQVPVGRHELGGCRLVIEFPEGSCVDRPAGTAGEGRNYYTLAPSEPSIEAVLLYLQRTAKKLPEAKAVELWKESIAAAAVLPKGAELLPPEARAAIKAIQTSAKLCDQPTRATPAARAGHKQAVVRLESCTV